MRTLSLALLGFGLVACADQDPSGDETSDAGTSGDGDGDGDGTSGDETSGDGDPELVEQELFYDDDGFESMSSPWEEEPGGMLAVRFTAPSAGRVVGARFFVTEEGTPDVAFAARVFAWDATTSTPGAQLGTDVEAVAGPSGGWIEVDFSDQDIAIDGEFVVAMRWLTPPSLMQGADAQFLGVDTTEPDGRTYWNFASEGAWVAFDEVAPVDGDAMIRATVELPAE